MPEKITLESLAADLQAKRIAMDAAALRYQAAVSERDKLLFEQHEAVGEFNLARFCLTEFAEKEWNAPK